jgi:hypothetical protein
MRGIFEVLDSEEQRWKPGFRDEVRGWEEKEVLKGKTAQKRGEQTQASRGTEAMHFDQVTCLLWNK